MSRREASLPFDRGQYIIPPPYLNMSADDTATGAQSDEKATSIMYSFVVTVLEEYQGNAIKPVRIRIHAPPLNPGFR